MITALIIALCLPTMALYLIWTLDLFAISELSRMLIALGWGMVAFATAFIIQTTIIGTNLLLYNQVALYSAPVLEEILKSGILFWMMWRSSLSDEVDGTAYGFAVGTGFAMVENVIYVVANPETAVGLAIARGISTSLMHASTSALVGTAISNSMMLPLRARLNRAGSGLFTAIVLHAIFNAVALSVEGTLLLFSATAIGLGSAVYVVRIVHIGLKHQKERLNIELGALTVGQVDRAVLYAETIAELVMQQRRLLGRGRTRLVRDYVSRRARLALMQNSIRTATRPQLREMLGRNIMRTQRELDLLEQSMGIFTRIWLQRILPDADSEIWHALDSETIHDAPLLQRMMDIDERAALLSDDELGARVDILRKTDLFASLSSAEHRDLAVLIEAVTYRAGDTVLSATHTGSALFIVADGHFVAEATAPEKNTELVVFTYVQGNVFGEAAFAGAQHHRAEQISCLSDGLCYVLQAADFLDLLQTRPQISLAMIRHNTSLLHQRNELIRHIQQSTRE